MGEKTKSKKAKSSDIALKVEHVSKSFHLPTEQASGIKQAFINWTRGIKGYKEQHVLDDISFTVEKGDFFGIVGRNGSGKSTLLKLISQIYTPDKGKITVNGKLVPFIELGVGFNPELTGRENIYLNGALLGFSHEEMSAMYDDIVKFAELEDFMDQKLKNYSSGMQVRLAFSIAIKADADILVLDEVLAVGDEAFQRKCFGYFAELKKNKKTVILVTHSMESVQRFCNKAILIDRESDVIEGNSAEVAQIYREINSAISDDIEDIPSSSKEGDEPKTNRPAQPIIVKATCHKDDDYVKFTISIIPKKDIEDAVVSLFLDRDTGEQVYRFSSDERIGSATDFKKGMPVNINLKLQNIFPNGVFTLRVSIKKSDRSQEFALLGNVASFEVDNKNRQSEWDIHWRPREEYSIK
ncbi:ABC transporter ATP-binding protein [Candidatus Saccharibacteria bacterium]|nr:ABC transporter ATP-binding protein [Candidatus Saccharibacteria bacterium]